MTLAGVFFYLVHELANLERKANDRVGILMALPGKPWHRDAIAATQGNNSKLGSILLAALGHQPPSGKRMFSRTAVITSGGSVVANYVDKYGDLHTDQFVCSVRDLRDNFRNLADTIKMNDADREDMFNVIRNWIAHDHSGLGVDFKLIKEGEA